MKLIFILFIITFFVVFFIAKFINYSTRVVDAEKKILQANIYDNILETYSVSNAGIINSLLSSKNSPIRPENVTFIDGVMKSINGHLDTDLPECKLINLRDVVIDNSSEDTNGSC